MSDDKYINDSQQRLMEVIRTLAGQEVDGLAPGDIAKLVSCHPSQVTRDLANLKHFGWAEQISPTNRWRLGPQVVQIATRHMTAIDRARTKLAEVSQRYSRSDS